VGARLWPWQVRELENLGRTQTVNEDGTHRKSISPALSLGSPPRSAP
jgi:hypothetical protein